MKQVDYEVRPSGIAVIRDDFDNGLNQKIWTTKKIEEGRLTFEILGKQNVAKIELRKGDCRETSQFGTITERTELMEAKDIQLPLGTDAWYAFSFLFPSNFPTIDNRTVFAQWKQKTEKAESPFLSFQYRKGNLFCKIANSNEQSKFISAIDTDLRGSWHRMVVNYQLNPDQTGKAQCWLDGQQFVNYQGRVGYESEDPLTYFKMGLYRDQADQPQSIYLAQYRRGLKPEDCTI